MGRQRRMCIRDGNVVGTIELSALKTVGDHGNTAVVLLPGHASALMLTGNEPALQIPREPVSLVGRLLE